MNLDNNFGVKIEYINAINLRTLFTSSQLDVSREYWLKDVIYCIQNQVNLKCYIGQARDFLTRFTDDYRISHLTSYTDQCKGCLDCDRILYRAFNKYKSRNFNVYILESNVLNLNEREKYWIDTLHTCIYDPKCWGYNMTFGGDDTSNLNSIDSIRKRQETQTRLFGYPGAQMHSDIAMNHRIETNRVRYGEDYAWSMGACHTPEAELKQRLSASDTNRSRYGEEYAYVTGGCHTPEARAKIIETNRIKYGEEYASIAGACQTPEAKAKKDQTFLKIYGTKAGAMNEEYSVIKRNLTHIEPKLRQLHDYFLDHPELEINPNTICEAPVGPIFRGVIVNLSKVDKYYFDYDDIYRMLEDSYRWMIAYLDKDTETIDWESLTRDRLSNPNFIH